MPEDIANPRPLPGVDGGEGNGPRAAAGQVAERAQNTAHQAAGQAQERLRAELNQRSSQAAAKITEQASDMRSVSQALREQGRDGPAQAAERIAGYAENVGGYLRDKDSDQLLADAEDFGRRQPWVIAAGGLALGFAASRFLKASSSRRYQAPRVNHPSSSPPSAGNGVGAESTGTEASSRPARPGTVPVV